MTCGIMRLEFRLSKVGFPIRKSVDQSSFAAPHGLSQRSTSFVASHRQGIHRTPLRHLIALIINIHPTRQNGNCLLLAPHTNAKRKTARRTVKPSALQAADMIRKTSLLRKIEPTTRRSSFVGKDRNTEAMQAKRSCANPGDYIAAPADCSADPLFGSISSLRCQKSRTPHPEGRVMRNDVFAECQDAARWRIS